MLFSSYEFLLVFLPAVIAGFAIARQGGAAAGRLWLLGCSAAFYACWNPVDLAMLAASVGVNFLLVRQVAGRRERDTVGRLLVAAGVAGNLGLLGYFKYSRFAVETVSGLTGVAWTGGDIVLPLAISFYTFQQIACLVDAWRMRTAPRSLAEYALFVMFFPQLIAGPIVHHAEVLPQFSDGRRFRLRWEASAVGLAYLAVGLLKKVVIADSLAPLADAVFDHAAAGGPLAAADAWAGTAAYSLQLYFDFSGYSDMAIGLGWLFGIRLPANFNAPYQAASLADFWRRWHMTLSRFLRDYLYIPLGGNRCGARRQSLNLLITMLLGGLWHGAGWTFVLWGGWHGLWLIVERVGLTPARRDDAGGRSGLAARIAARGWTLLLVALGWVLFRSADATAAVRMYHAMLGGDDWALRLVEIADLGLIAGLLALSQMLPTTQALIPDPDAVADAVRPPLPRPWRWLEFRPTPLRGAALSLVFLTCITLLTRVQEFLYFQF